MKKAVITFLALFVCSISLQAQYKLSEEKSNMYIDGTSTLHDWTEIVEQMAGTLALELNDNKISKVKSLNLTVPVESIKSGKSGMDKNTYKALKSDKHPTITYKLESFRVEGDYIHYTGQLTIAGTTKTVKFKSKYEVYESSIELEGSHDFKMTDFNVDPPTAVLGTIKTGDEIKIRFNLVFEK